MNGQEREKRESLDVGISQEEIERLIKERKVVGAISCKVVTENGQEVLVCRYPPV